MERFIFSISIILLIVLFNLLKKSSNKINIITAIILSIILFFSYNSFLIFILSIFKIKATMLIRSIMNLSLSGFIFYKIRKNKQIQKFYFNYVDLIIIILLIFFTFFIYNYRFKNNNLIFESIDPSIHFSLGEQFSEHSTLSMNVTTPNKLFYTNTFDLFSSYTTLGTIFQIFGNKNTVTNARIFIYFETIIYLISGIFFYLSITKKDNNMLKKAIALGLTITYLFGYPFNNLIFGFHYLGMSILLINVIIYLFNSYYEDNKTNKIIFYICLFLLNFNVFTMYYLFVPIIYGAEGLYLLYRYFILKKIKFKDLLRDSLYTLIIPFIIGIFLYFIYPKFHPLNSPGVNPFSIDGYIYRNLFGNFILFIPFIIYIFINDVKNKKITVIHLAYPFILIFMIFVFYKIYNLEFAAYYYYKFYFLLSLFVFLLIAKEVLNSKLNIYTIFVIYIFILSLMQFLNIEQNITNKVSSLNPVNSISSVNDVLRYNQEIIKTKEPAFTSKQLNDLNPLIKQIKENEIKNENIVSSFSILQKLWFYSISKIDTTINSNFFSCYCEDLNYHNILMNDNIKYFLAIKSNKTEQKFLENNFILLYSNESFKLYQKK